MASVCPRSTPARAVSGNLATIYYALLNVLIHTASNYLHHDSKTCIRRAVEFHQLDFSDDMPLRCCFALPLPLKRTLICGNALYAYTVQTIHCCEHELP